MKREKEKRSLSERIRDTLTNVIYFVTYDIWRITEHEVSGLKRSYIFMVKTVILAVRGFQRENLQTRASALTYNTLLAIVPLFAVILGIASGFGLSEIVRSALYDYSPAHSLELNKILDFAESYLKMAKGGIFIGVGLLLLFYTVINLISSIEHTFNEIWQIKQERSWRRKVTDYLALFIILPLLTIISSGLSIFISTIKNSFVGDHLFMTPLIDTLIVIIPFLITILVFTTLYMLTPNTKVGFLNALSAGFITGCAFQLFQYLYISGQIWVSKYNAIYGSFAAFPLLLLWLQLSWLICLFGAEITYASQNVKKFSFERDSKNISRRYFDFLTLLIMTLIIKRFEKGEAPYNADEISDQYEIPIRLTTRILYLLTEIGLVIEVNNNQDDRIAKYQPAMDIHQITVGVLFKKMDEHGSENFKIDTQKRFKKEWEVLIKTREATYMTQQSTLLKDLE